MPRKAYFFNMLPYPTPNSIPQPPQHPASRMKPFWPPDSAIPPNKPHVQGVDAQTRGSFRQGFHWKVYLLGAVEAPAGPPQLQPALLTISRVLDALWVSWLEVDGN